MASGTLVELAVEKPGEILGETGSSHNDFTIELALEISLQWVSQRRTN